MAGHIQPCTMVISWTCRRSSAKVRPKWQPLRHVRACSANNQYTKDLARPPGEVTCLATVCSSGSCSNMEAPSTMAWLARVAPPMVPIMLTAARPEPAGRAVCWRDEHSSASRVGSANPAACCSLLQACRQSLCFTPHLTWLGSPQSGGHLMLGGTCTSCAERTTCARGAVAPQGQSTAIAEGGSCTPKGRVLPCQLVPAWQVCSWCTGWSVTCLATNACKASHVQQPLWQLATLWSHILQQTMLSHP